MVAICGLILLAAILRYFLCVMDSLHSSLANFKMLREEGQVRQLSEALIASGERRLPSIAAHYLVADVGQCSEGSPLTRAWRDEFQFSIRLAGTSTCSDVLSSLALEIRSSDFRLTAGAVVFWRLLIGDNSFETRGFALVAQFPRG